MWSQAIFWWASIPCFPLQQFPLLKVTSGGVCKLGDFGCSVGLAASGKGPAVELTGTPGYQVGDLDLLSMTLDVFWIIIYQAPELLKGDAPTRACDVYSLGILLWQLDSRSIPYPGQHPQVYFHFLVFPSIYFQVIRWSCSKWSQWLRDPGHQPHLQLQSVCRNLSRSIQLAGRRRLVRGGYDRVLKNWKVVYNTYVS